MRSFVVSIIIGLSLAPSAAAQPATVPTTRVATLERAATSGERQTAVFGRPVAHVGDRIEQTIAFEMRLNSSRRQGNRLAEMSRTTLRTAQRRVITVGQVADGHTVGVLVQYLEASNQMCATDAADAPVSAAAEAQRPMPVPQPVQGKSYHCRRDAGENGKLIVTDAEGKVPPPAEYEIVAKNMETVGRPNPLAEYLVGRAFAVGETIALPKSVADRLFGLGEQFGEVARFDLTLREVRDQNGAPVAVFQTSVEAVSNSASQMRLAVEGPLAVEIDTCRAVQSDLSGPIGMSESRGSYSTAYQLIGTGQLDLRITSTFRDAKR